MKITHEEIYDERTIVEELLYGEYRRHPLDQVESGERKEIP